MKCLTSLLGVTGIVVFSIASHAQTITIKSGKWSSPSTWSNGIVPDATAGEIIINHNVIIPSDTLLSVDDLTINASLSIAKNATVILQHAQNVLSDLRLQTGRLNVSGRLICRDSAMMTGTTVANTFFLDSSFYEHQYFSIAGEPPTATWSELATLELTGYTTGKSLSSPKWNQVYGNVIYNCAAQRSGTFVEMLGNIQTVKGSLIISSTGSGVVRVTLDKTSLTTITIGKDFVIEGRSRVWMSRNGTTTLNVSGNFNYHSAATASSYLTTQGTGALNVDGNVHINTAGILRFASSGGGNGTLSVKGNLNVETGTLTLAAPGRGKIILNGTLPQHATLLGTVTKGVDLQIENSTGITVQSGSRTSGNILVTASSDLTLPEGNFTIQGNLASQNGGHVHSSNGTLHLTGTDLQNINLYNDTLSNITIAKSAGSSVVISSPLNISGTLNVATPGVSVISNGNITLISTSDDGLAEGIVASLSTGSSIEGSVTVQRFMSGEGRIYRYLSTPVSGVTVADWKDDFAITGPFDDPSTGPGINSTGASLFFYDEREAVGGWINYPSVGRASDNPLMPGKGYSAFIRNANAPTVWDLTGILNQHEFNFSLTHTTTSDTLNDGWNLIGNPYPSSIDWDSEDGWIKSNVSEKIAIRDNSTGMFKYWDGSVGSLGSGRIGKGQAFWVQTSGNNPTLTLREVAKTLTSQVFYRVNQSDVDYVEVKMSNEKISDNAYLRIRNDATLSFDKHDIVKWPNDHLSLSFTIDAIPLVIAATDKINCGAVIPLTMDFTLKSNGNFDPGYEGSYFLHVIGAGLFQYAHIQLYDHYQDSIISNHTTPYQFFIDENPGSSDPKRFSLSIEQNAANRSMELVYDSLRCDQSPAAVIKLKNPMRGARYTCSLNQWDVESFLAKDQSLLRFTLSDDQLSYGMNSVTITARNVCGTIDAEHFPIRKTEKLAPPLLTQHNGWIASNYVQGDWYFNGEKIMDESPVIRPESSGTYENIVDVNGCTATATTQYIFQDDHWQCFPVPAARHLIITAPEYFSIRQVRIVALTGATLRELSFEPETTQVVINTEGLPDGIYLAELRTGDGNKTIRFIKKSE
jgi:hypothetical protein